MHGRTRDHKAYGGVSPEYGATTSWGKYPDRDGNAALLDGFPKSSLNDPALPNSLSPVHTGFELEGGGTPQANRI